MRRVSGSPGETEKIGQEIGRMLGRGDVVALYGDLGAGKTTLIRGIAAAHGVDARDVVSPSFTVVAEYEGDLCLGHADLYRVHSADDLESSGFWEYLGPDRLCVIEWPERAEAWLPERTIRIRLKSCGDTCREIEVQGLEE